ncbi:MAG: hypothetical protein ACI3Z5_06935 [Paludibacteraceae bacterium]
MAKYIPIEMVKEFRGKICSHSDVYFAKRNGTLYTGKICNPNTAEPTEQQLAHREKFKAAQTAARTALADPTQREALQKAFKSQKRYSTLWGYTFAQEYAKLTD